MTRISYRLALAAVCSLAAYAGPAYFLQDPSRTGYLPGGLAAALLAWAFLAMASAVGSRVPPAVQGLIGGGAALLSWAMISLVAVFDVIPFALRNGMQRFDPVWLLEGFAPAGVLALCAWRVRQRGGALWEGAAVGLFRFSVPLFGLQVAARAMGLSKHYIWLFLFTGVMFLTLDALAGWEEKGAGSAGS